MVMNEFLFSHSTWIVETVDKMIEQTKRKRIKGKIAEEQERDGADAPDLAPVKIRVIRLPCLEEKEVQMRWV